ncbi:hypothetical protein [Petrachloros mirabilis]
MKILGMCILLIFPASICWAESETEKPQVQEPTLYDHFHIMKRMQENLAGRSLEEQAKLQPQIQREQRQACERLRKDHQDRVSRDDYRRQGGDEFLVFSWELEQWCGTLR